MHDTASSAQREAFLTQMTEQMTSLATRLSQWASSEAHTLTEMEAQTRSALQTLGQAVLTGLCALRQPAYAADQVPCACGQMATYQRQRTITVTTLLGVLAIKRPYYLCATCHQGHAPLDRQLGVCAGGTSLGLDRLLARLGVHAPFAEAADLVEQTLLVAVCANTVRDATERLGKHIAAAEQQVVDAAWEQQPPCLPAGHAEPPERLYISMDGVLVHTHEEGWKELKLGSVYTTTSSTAESESAQSQSIRAQEQSFYADFATPQLVGRALWLEAVRRGVLQTQEVIAIGDGAHWIWNLVAEHFPQAVQIVDWYHATQYLWNVAKALYGEGTQMATTWAQQRMTELWEGQVATVIQHLQIQTKPSAIATVQAALSYYSTNQARMRYAEYRAKGYQIGSGTIESGCKHVIGARLKQAGMIWTIAGARAVAKARARLKSGRWTETIALLPARQRSYRHQAV